MASKLEEIMQRRLKIHTKTLRIEFKGKACLSGNEFPIAISQIIHGDIAKSIPPAIFLLPPGFSRLRYFSPQQ